MDCDAIHRLSQDSSKVRNFCMMAHVDHGKTTLSDHLLTSNGILSTSLAGKVRFLDSRPDEIEKEITMKASCIALRHHYEGADHLVHLVDSPGHIDFSSEVSSATRLCDGALILVDVVDGVSMQTESMLRQAYREGLGVVLVMTKIDLLITRLQMDPEEAYLHLRTLVESCNVVLSSYVAQQIISSSAEDVCGIPSPGGTPMGDISDGNWFCPTRGNVIFVSSLEAWGFSLDTFAKIYEQRLGMNAKKLRQVLWGEFYFDPKAKTVSRKPKSDKHSAPMAVRFIFEPLWKMYEMFLAEPMDKEKCIEMTKKVAIPSTVWDGSAKRDARTQLQLTMSTWLSLPKSVLDAVCEQLPSPPTSQQRRLRYLCPKLYDTTAAVDAELLKSLEQCNTDPSAPMVATVAKLLDTMNLAGHIASEPSCEELEETFVAFARVCSGRVRKGMRIFVNSNNEMHETTVGAVFLLRGRGLEEVPEVCAGSLCGISGLTKYITKSATLSEAPSFPAFRSMTMQSSSIVRQSIEPKNPRELRQLMQGLKLLNRVDPQVEVSVLPTGQPVISAAGEIHAERCIYDLNTQFARVEITVSEPIVSFRETIVAATMKPKPVTVTTAGGHLTISVYALPFPEEVLDIVKADDFTQNASAPKTIQKLLCERGGKKWQALLQHEDSVISHGPTKNGYCGALLVDGTVARGPRPPSMPASPSPEMSRGGSAEDLSGFAPHPAGSGEGAAFSDVLSMFSDESNAAFQRRIIHKYNDSVVGGFQLAAAAGPIMQEPLFGVVFVLDDVVCAPDAPETNQGGPISGQIMAAVNTACRNALTEHGRRVVEPYYHCCVYSSGATQKKIYALLNRRRATIMDEIAHEGSNIFHIECQIPVAESIGLQDDLRIHTSGAASAQLRMSHWEVNACDPLYRPTTQEELEEHGTDVGAANVATDIMNKVRRRKGLLRENIVTAPEKQKFSVRGS